MKLNTLPETLAVSQLDPNSPIPLWAVQSKFYAIHRTFEELSIICNESAVPQEVKSERGWRAFKVEGPLDFSLTGVLASIANPLAEAKISIFAISTFDTDYVMVKESDLEKARTVLTEAGFYFT